MDWSAVWALAVVPTATGVVAVFAFSKLLRENQKLGPEIERLERERSAAGVQIHIPSALEADKYGRARWARRVLIPAVVLYAGLAALHVYRDSVPRVLSGEDNSTGRS